MTEQYKYLNIPLQMLQELHINDTKFFNDCFDVGVFLYSNTLHGGEVNRYMDSIKFFSIQNMDVKKGIANAKRIIKCMPAKYPIVGIEKDMLFDFYLNKKEPYDIMCLSAFLGIKSIVGVKPFIKTNKAHIHARMFGYGSIKELPKKLKPIEEKYLNRRQMDKVLIELQLNWHLKLFSNHQRGMILSFDLSLDELAIITRKDKQDIKIQQLKEAKRKAIESAKRKAIESAKIEF